MTMSIEVADRIELLKTRFPNFVVTDELLPFLECAEINARAEESEDDSWIPVPNADLLKAVKPLMDPECHDVFEEADRWAEVVKDVNGGVTFAFYWNGEYLNWER